jgi:fructokinase
MGDRDKYQASVEKWAAISSVIKVSDDDMAWLYPGVEYAEVARRWVSDGAAPSPGPIFCKKPQPAS